MGSSVFGTPYMPSVSMPCHILLLAYRRLQNSHSVHVEIILFGYGIGFTVVPVGYRFIVLIR